MESNDVTTMVTATATSKKNRFYEQNNNSFLYSALPSRHNCEVKWPNFSLTGMEGDNFYYLFLNFNVPVLSPQCQLSFLAYS